MNLKEWLHKLFRKKSLTTSIIVPGNNVLLPTRDTLEDKTVLEELDKYKNEYLQILSHRKIFTSKDLEDGFREEVSMNTDLLLKAIGTNEMEELFFQDVKKEELLTLRNQISLYKLNDYYETMNRLEKEMTLRSIALKEILEEKFLLSSLKKNAIREEVNHLETTIAFVRVQKQAMILEANSHILAQDKNTVNPSIKSTKASALRNMVRSTFPSYPITEEQSIKELAKLERMLEVHFYKQKKKKEPLEVDDDIPAFKLWAMAIYGVNLVTEKDLTEFYEREFDQWMGGWWIGKTKYVPDGVREYFFCKIIEKMISDLLNGKLGSYENILDARTVARATTNFLKKDGKFDSTEILHNEEKVNFIFSFKNTGSVEYYFKTYCCHSHNSSDCMGIDLHKDIITPMPAESLELLFFLAYINRKTPPLSYQANHLYPIYVSLRKRQDEKFNTFRFPDRIKQLNSPNDSRYEISTSSKKWIQNLRNQINGKRLIIPPSIELISGNMFDYLEFQEVIFEGSICLTNAFQNCEIAEVYFKQLPKIQNSFKNTNIKHLHLFASNRDTIIKFLYEFFQIEKKEASNHPHKNRSTLSFHTVNFSQITKTAKLTPRFETLQLTTNDGEKTFNRGDLTIPLDHINIKSHPFLIPRRESVGIDETRLTRSGVEQIVDEKILCKKKI